MERPTDYKYCNSHEWLRVDDKDIGYIGITDFAVKSLRDLVYVDMPSIEELLDKGKPFGEIESVKAVADLNSPVDGEVLAINEEIEDNIDLVTRDPYGEGWIIKIKITDPAQIDDLMGVKAYDRFLSNVKQ